MYIQLVALTPGALSYAHLETAFLPRLKLEPWRQAQRLISVFFVVPKAMHGVADVFH